MLVSPAGWSGTGAKLNGLRYEHIVLIQKELVSCYSECVLTSHPPDPAGLFSEGSEVMKLHIEGSLTIYKPGIKRV